MTSDCAPIKSKNLKDLTKYFDIFSRVNSFAEANKQDARTESQLSSSSPGTAPINRSYSWETTTDEELDGYFKITSTDGLVNLIAESENFQAALIFYTAQAIARGANRRRNTTGARKSYNNGQSSRSNRALKVKNDILQRAGGPPNPPDDDGDDSEDDDGDPKRPPQGPLSWKEPKNKRTVTQSWHLAPLRDQAKEKPFMCPYFKYDPDQFGSLESCGGSNWPTIHRVK